MITTFLGIQGPEATSLLDGAHGLGTTVVLAEPELLVLAARDAVDTHVDDEIACVVWGDPGLEHLSPPAPGRVATRLAAAHRRHGEDAISLLRPPFAVVLWRREDGTGLVATDQLGARSVFTARLRGSLAFSGEVADLLSVLPTRPAPDLSALTSWLAGQGMPTDRTLYSGIERLPGGSLLRLGQNTAATYRYAARSRRPVLRQDADEVAQLVRNGIQRAVGSRIAADSLPVVLLSGGIDSTSVAAATVRAAGAERPLAVSAVFPDRPEADESAFISATIRALSLRGEQVAIKLRPLLADGLDFLERWQLPSASPTLGFQLGLQQLAKDLGATIVLDGEGGDELFGLRPYLIADDLRGGRLIHAWRLSRSLGDDAQAGRRALVLYGLKGAAPLMAHRVRKPRRPVWLREDVSHDLPEATMGHSWKSNRGPRWYAEGRDLLTEQRERTGAHDYLRRRAVMAGSVSAHPFLQDLDLIELALTLPPVAGFLSDNDRPALRAAMRGELPDVVRLRSGKSYFNHLFEEALRGPDRLALESLLGPGAALCALVRPSFLEDLVATPPDRRRGIWTWTAWRFATAECWLRLQSDQNFRELLPELETVHR